MGLDTKQTPYVVEVAILKVLASEKRLTIMEWLKDPMAHFPAQRDGDLVTDGVCSVFMADKLGVSQPTASEHLKLLTAVACCRPRGSSSGPSTAVMKAHHTV